MIPRRKGKLLGNPGKVERPCGRIRGHDLRLANLVMALS